MTPKGGSEILHENLIKYAGLDLEKINLILSVCEQQQLSNNKPNILWQHLSYDQSNVLGMTDSQFVKNLNQIVYVSKWQQQKFQEKFNHFDTNSIVIQNAIEPISFIEKPKTTKLKLIYTSTPWRGLDVLLDVIELLDRNDIELDVYSSTIIYGKDFMPNAFDWLFQKCRNTKNVNYRGYATNKAIRKALQTAHIFSYPNTFEETSCLSAIEAGAAGCKIVTSRYGALPETCNIYADMVNYHNRQQLIYDYAKLLNTVIDEYRYIENNTLKDQSNWFNEHYSWTNRIEEWKQLIKTLQGP